MAVNRKDAPASVKGARSSCMMHAALSQKYDRILGIAPSPIQGNWILS